MNNLSIRIVSVLVILLFCLSPLGAVDLNQENNATHSNICKGADFKDVNSIIDSDKLDPDLRISVDDIFVDQKAVVKVKADESLNANAYLKLKSYKPVEDTTVKIVNGVGNMTVDELLPSGNYSVEIIFDGNNKFRPGNASANFTVNRYDPNLCISVDDVHVGEKPVVKIMGNKSLYAYPDVALFDSNHNPLCGIAIKVAHGFGSYAFDYDLAPGRYSAVVKYYGDDRFVPCEKSVDFNVYKANVGLSVSVDDVLKNEDPIVKIKANESINKDVAVKLKSNGSDIAGSNVTLVNGEGNWTVNENLEPGNYSILVTFSGDDTFNRSEKTTNFTVSDKCNPHLNVSVDDISVGGKPLVHVKADPLLNGTVTVKLKFRGSDFIITNTRVKVVDGEGNLTIGTLMPQGNYSIAANFGGDDYFIEEEKTIDFTVN